MTDNARRKLDINGRDGGHFTLRDGTLVQIRPIRADDAPRLQGLFGRLTPQTIYFRFLAPRRALSDADASRLARVDRVREMAFVATVPGRGGDDQIIAVARYAVFPEHPDLAEAAIVVEDLHQRQGLGRQLLSCLAAYARDHGVRAFTASIDPNNRQILSFVRSSGLTTELRSSGGLLDVCVPLV